MFDKATIQVKAGNGGNGSVSFRREKFVPFGGPDGGDGGSGGNVIIRADNDVTSLVRFRYKGLHRAGNGGNGLGRKMHGKNGADIVLAVPLGTMIWEKTPDDSKCLIADLAGPGQEVVVARGGRGGYGNTHFVSSTHQSPRIARKGDLGEERSIILELRLIADVGIIGYPNVGKSSLLAASSAANPKIAGYAFTTLEPALGVVTIGQDSFILAEIPGLIEGAHTGRGLGYDFLRHATRTKIFIHLIDGTSVSPVEDMVMVNNELILFDQVLAQKKQLVAVNKIDLPEVQSRLAEIRRDFREAGLAVVFISAASGEGVGELMAQAMKMLGQVETKVVTGEITPQKVFRPLPKAPRASVSKKENAFVIASPELEHTIDGMDTTSTEVRRYLRGQLDRLGVTKALLAAGVKPGDKVRCGLFEWEW